MTEPNELARWRASFQEEIEAAALYRAMSEVEARPEINVEDAAIAFVYSADDTTPAQCFMSVTRIEEALEAHGRKMIHAQKAGE